MTRPHFLLRAAALLSSISLVAGLISLRAGAFHSLRSPVQHVAPGELNTVDLLSSPAPKSGQAVMGGSKSGNGVAVMESSELVHKHLELFDESTTDDDLQLNSVNWSDRADPNHTPPRDLSANSSSPTPQPPKPVKERGVETHLTVMSGSKSIVMSGSKSIVGVLTWNGSDKPTGLSDIQPLTVGKRPAEVTQPDSQSGVIPWLSEPKRSTSTRSLDELATHDSVVLTSVLQPATRLVDLMPGTDEDPTVEPAFLGSTARTTGLNDMQPPLMSSDHKGSAVPGGSKSAILAWEPLDWGDSPFFFANFGRAVSGSSMNASPELREPTTPVIMHGSKSATIILLPSEVDRSKK